MPGTTWRGMGAVAALLLCTATAAQADGGRSADWRRYVLGPDGTDVRPVRVASVSGEVSNARALSRDGRGLTTLTMRAGGPAPVIVLDYGVDVGGLPYLDVASVDGTPTIRASFSESGRYIDADGDNGGLGPCCGLAPPAAEPFRYNEFSPSGPGLLKTTFQQGGQRFERITLTTPGTVRMRAAGVDFKAFVARPRDYQGWFQSSDRTLNRIWYAGAYTAQLNMVPPGTQNDNPQPLVVDGAKRDRAVWSGDLVIQNPVIWTTLGTNGSEYVKQSLLQLARQQLSSGTLPGVSRVNLPRSSTYSISYSMHAANAMVDYYRYTGDEAFARQVLPVVEKQLAADATLVDERGLLVTRAPDADGLCNAVPVAGSCGFDWDIYDGAKTGAVTAFNAIYYHALREAAWLQERVGDGDKADAYEARAAALKAQINAVLWNPAMNGYGLSDIRRDVQAQDAGALAVLYGVAPRRAALVLQGIKDRLWTPYGTSPFAAGNGFSPVISPFVNGLEAAARYERGDTADALELTRRLWGIMVRPGIDYTGGLWEKMSPTGTVDVLTGADPVDNQSLAHGWAAGPTYELSQYVLGVVPVEPGYRKWLVEPHQGDLRWAAGRVPTAYGPIKIRWWRNGRRTTLSVNAPAGTSGHVELPLPSRDARVRVDNRPVPVARAARVRLGAGRHVITVG